MAYIGFNARNVAPAQGLELLPIGQYHVACVDSERKMNSANTGEFLKLVFEVLEGDYKGRKLFDQITLSNANPKAVEVGHSVLSQLCHAVNVLDLQDSAQLHNLALWVDVGIKKGNGEFPDKNRILFYSNKSKENTPLGGVPPFAKPPAQNLGAGGKVSSFSSVAGSKSTVYPQGIGSIRDDDVPF